MSAVAGTTSVDYPPSMTGSTSMGYTATASVNSTDAWKAFDSNVDATWASSNYSGGSYAGSTTTTAVSGT
eukprot:29453-Eustigmatos_ZCMA.PRE.1